MLAHVDPSVSTIEEYVSQELVTVVEEIQTHILVIQELLMKHGLIPANHVSFEDCVSNPETCEKLKGCVQQLMYQETV